MVITKTLALKTLSGLVAVGATVGSVFLLGSNLSSSGNDPEVEKLTVGELLGKVGLSCGLADDLKELTDNTPKDCTVKTEGSINVKVGEQEEEGVTFTSGTQKLKLSKEEGYPKSLKFVVDSGDLNLTKKEGNTPATTIKKLEQFETYEIKREGGKYYLTRKNEASENIASLLGLPSSCKPSSSSVTCSNLSAQDLQKINFHDKDTGNPTSGTATLTISKATDTTKFPLGYKFALNSGQDITFKDTNIVKANTNTEFKIKKSESNPTTLSLEKAWSDFSFAEKAGLNCTNSSGTDTFCSKSGSANINVKKGEDKKHDITGINGSNSEKIKVEKDQEGYNQGLKFTITGGDVSLTGGTESKTEDSKEDFSVLEEYETYEIKESGGKYYLTRKDESIVFIKKQLGIDSFCSENTWTRAASNNSGSSLSFMCDNISLENLKKIKFNNNNNSWPTETINLQLTITKSKTNNSGTYGDMEVEISDQGSSASSVCIPNGAGGSVDLKSSGSEAKYKIKKGASSWCLVKSGSSSGQCAN